MGKAATRSTKDTAVYAPDSGAPDAPPPSSSAIEDLKQRIASLPRHEFATFNAWYQEWFQDEWDRQMEEDAAAGVGVFGDLAEEALREFKAGKTTPL